ncbi:MAG TPA: ATP-dependent DNA helicase RecG, partial [Acidobacteriota bacterium]|nr:ATP-dependent DNA helicase RecG [Acidobacteriota bacterium]
MSKLDPGLPIQYVKGVGPRVAKMLETAGIKTVEDFLRYSPFRYENRSNLVRIRDLVAGQEAVVHGKILFSQLSVSSRKRVRIFRVMVSDGSGSIPVTFFNQPYLQKVFEEGKEVVLFGTARFDSYQGAVGFQNPEYELVEDDSENSVIHTGRIVPVYRRISRLNTRFLRKLMYHILQSLDRLDDPLPDALRSRYRFPSRLEALRLLHFPEHSSGEPGTRLMEALSRFRTPAQQRMIFEEFFTFQLGLQLIRRRRETVSKDRKIKVNSRVRQAVKSILPFRPTEAQKKVLAEIVGDLTSPRVMSRLLQGDVGSGKTIVALQALVVVMENGFQTALMAPTELLAEQHYRKFQKYLSGTQYRLAFLSSRIKSAERTRIMEALQQGNINLIVGTHALIQEGVHFKNLGLVVVDEQHRFGVLQRSRLMEKGGRPDTLVMTATPIPRSLALTVYGDLDISILDELPPGRQPVKTVLKTEASRSEVYSVLKSHLDQGRQAYIVYPLIEESEKVDLKAATEMADHLSKDVLQGYSVGLIHGRMSSDERDQIMNRFHDGQVQVLVSTTVIEVGIDVPNATVMIIEHAERFGLSQLHQLRGRIGRGKHSSLCILMVDRVRSREAYERLDIMRRSSDGFRIAEKDLEIRGPGEFVGTRQSGMPQ